MVGHIEDIVSLKEYRGNNFGKWYLSVFDHLNARIIEQLKHIADAVGCYKVILDCSDSNVPFYEKCGFEKKEVQMVVYLSHNDKIKQNKDLTPPYVSKL